ncbi:F0F1 ATP synthase subunit gamma [Cutibacterium avidum]|uniref:ATP synthase gamma chain n=1 Tax=Cutibacterium avidum ATCC 25577 TaxID=997355 RepID=G4CZ37_9ACTN|nr:F0F1 ATP synthase subunit gamma [Cutibacterium avidum]ERS36898.1 ATP synthase gamma chain [Propionibacterium sp. KPL1838]ERS65869.1 ATP synthase gamma chain [Propionibacterium sp. KPL1852]MBS6259539.1 F0F1 ATP synthase subunit gamma [Propionibacterium sp.]EGY76756.1 ATP synthase F1 sector gamma subunit [Cutibacterium avidum ATCC 25577]ERF56398.1 ATP synthase F1 subunit gamma [Cutibacterium avidum TM16]
MASNLRELRERRNSVATTKKITRAMELIASSRIVKAQNIVRAASPYSLELTRALSAVASHTHEEHPLTSVNPAPKRSAVLLVTSDRGLAGAYSSNAIKSAEQLHAALRPEQEVVTYLCGRKGVQYFEFRGRKAEHVWSGFSDSPTYRQAREIADTLIEEFLRPTEEGGVDEIHIVYTHFDSMLTQKPKVVRLLPLAVVDPKATPEGELEAGDPGVGTSDEEIFHEYNFEPDPVSVLDQLLPLYVANRIHYALLQSAASELASRQRAMKAATDNAEQLIQSLSRQANQARQAAITQEITEIVGGAAALAESAPQE